MNVRKMCPSDYDEVRRVYRAARQFMKDNGNPNQWGDVWPDDQAVAEDIENGTGYVVEEGGRTVGAFALCLGDDPAYGYIEEGAWVDDTPYVTIHRLGSDGTAHGVFNTALQTALTLCPHVRIDTYKDNYPMQHLIAKAGFTYCGIVYIDYPNKPRLAYELHR